MLYLNHLKIKYTTGGHKHGEIHQAMNGMTLREMDKIIYPVCRLCRDHEKAGFIEGIKVGIHLATEIT